jgi:flagellar biosynthesis/type III secretory pathway chaperone
MQVGAPAADFAEVLAAELDALKSFIALLEQERIALRSNQADALYGLASEKSALVERLAQCATERERILLAKGVRADSEELNRFLGTEPQAGAIWDRILVAARRAAELNAGNGYTVNQRLAGVNRALGTLGGACSSLYDTRGTASHGLDASRSLGRV